GGSIFSRRRLGNFRSDAPDHRKVRLAFAARKVRRLDAAFLERMGHQLRFWAPDADGAKRTARVAELDGIIARLVRASAGSKSPAIEVTATSAWDLRSATANYNDPGAARIAVRVA